MKLMTPLYAAGKFLRAPAAAEVGLAYGIPGHYLGVASPPTSWGGISFDCSCGWHLWYEARSTGSPSKKTLRRWDDHLELWSTDPTTRFDVGTISTIKHGPARIFVAPRFYEHAGEFTDGRYRGVDAAGTITGANGWAVFSEAPGNKAILEIAESKDAAFTMALRKFDMAERRGSKVVRGCDALNLPGTDTVRTVTATLLGTPVEEIPLDQLQPAAQAIRELLALVPLLELRALQLETTRERKLMAPLERSSS